MAHKLVSVLIPAYNAAPWVRYALLSACGQTWPNKEVILVDDGSTDNTLAIARQFEAFGLVRVISQENRGAAAARNAALAASRGDYIQWLDADDLLDHNKIERQMFYRAWLKLDPKVLLSGAWAYFRYTTQRAKFESTPLWQISLTPTEWLFLKLSQNLHMQPGNWLVSRELTELAGPWNENISHDDDGEYFARLISKSEGTRFIHEAQSYYRQVGFGSLSHLEGNSKKLDSLFLSMELHIAYLLDLEDSDRTRRACVTYIHNWIHEFYDYRPGLVEQLAEMIRELGGSYVKPQLRPKYRWLGRAVGAKVQALAPRVRWSAATAWDRLLYQIGVP